MSDTKERVRSFLDKKFPTTRNIREDTALLGSGYIDSLGVLDIVTFLEQEFEIAVADEDLLPENFGCINSLCLFIERKSVNTIES